MDAPGAGLLAAAGLIGWVWGSFLNTVVDRTPRRDGCSPKLGWFSPARSICLGCRRPIPWQENLPVISYLALRGRCRSCGARIGIRTLAVEVATPLLFAALGLAIHPLRQSIGFAWSTAALSVALVTVPVLLERRRLRGIAAAWGLLTLAGVLLWWRP